MQHVADLQSLVDFFGVEPRIEYEDVPLDQNVVAFDVDLGKTNVWFSFIPRRSYAQLRVCGSPFSIVKLNFSDVIHLSVRKTAEDHYLQLQFASNEVEAFTLHLRPRLLVFWGNEVGVDDDDSHLESVGDA